MPIRMDQMRKVPRGLDQKLSQGETIGDRKMCCVVLCGDKH